MIKETKATTPTEDKKAKEPQRIMIPLSDAARTEVRELAKETGIGVDKIRDILTASFNSGVEGHIKELVKAELFPDSPAVPLVPGARPMGS